ncbi:PEP-CTERM sorting domain-containing protein [Luteolibacter sp. SL250]|uniref:PEP-CTERM sorting domain-containing protein n=1 Tax=Luteolibacter sp. SL250 TaxID=2995170 RepID=UPI00226E766E|nr:PEP-CTERM sorting domain-containing protein [Luteolibacter sp. SL250]WAC20688.1 PEP-CTERM sorting domain-containing protein [Luteolibacter sp. SL250]
MRISLPICCISGAFLAPAITHAALTDNFDTGTYPNSGTGWSAGWTQGASTGTVVSTNPLSGGGSYLSVTTGTTTSSNAGISRSIGTMAASPYTLTFNWRYDGNVSNFVSYDDRIHFGASTAVDYGTNANFTWLIGVVGGDNSTDFSDGEWYFYDGSSSTTTSENTFVPGDMQMTGMMLQSGVVYSFTVTVDPASQTYSASINDGSTFFSAASLNFRNQGATNGASNLLFGGATTGSPTADHVLTWSIDSINVVPEPSSGLLAGLSGLLCFVRRRIAH